MVHNAVRRKLQQAANAAAPRRVEFDGGSVSGRLPQLTYNLNRFNALFAASGLSQAEMIALSAIHTVELT